MLLTSAYLGASMELEKENKTAYNFLRGQRRKQRMPVTEFICPADKERISVRACLAVRGCRLKKRCATLPYLRMAAQTRPFNGVTPSMAGTGPRLILLRERCDYAINPYDQAFAALGTGSHGKLSVKWLTKGFLSEQGFSDDIIKGIPDLLEPDEEEIGFFILYDYKTSGSFKIAKALGLVESEDHPVLDKKGQPVRYRSGRKRGEIKYQLVRQPDKAELRDWALQLNRYRIVVERAGYPISRMIVQAIPRDGNTWIASSRGIEESVYLVEIPRLPDDEVLNFYDTLSREVEEAFKTGTARICDKFESWEGRRCRDYAYCPVRDYCKQMKKGKIFLP